MFMKTLLSGLLATGLALSVAHAATEKAGGKQPGARVLGEGHYTAKAKALVCTGCGPMIEKTMRDIPGIESAKVDSETAKVHFTVKEGASVKEADLQKTLKASADKMGMGADYRLSDIKVAANPSEGSAVPAETKPRGENAESSDHSGGEHGHHHHH